MKVVVLCSGGMDSVTALSWARETHDVIAALSFDYGAKHHDRELPLAAEHAARSGIRHEVIPLPLGQAGFRSALLKSGGEIPDADYGPESLRQTVVPFRNAILLSVATGWAESVGAEAVVIGAHGGDHVLYPDCREPFMDAMGEAMRLGTDTGVQLLRPFIGWNKGQIVQEGARLGVDFARTWSCYRGGAVHCGRCGTCRERRQAFQQAGRPDPTVYEPEPTGNA
jgi:7-cyano-7-deazaguanine synthase